MVFKNRKPFHYHLNEVTVQQILEEIPQNLGLKKLRKWKNIQKTCKLLKLVQICVFLFGVPKHIALNMVIKSTYILQNILIKLIQPQFQNGLTKNFDKWQKNEKMQQFWLKRS